MRYSEELRIRRKDMTMDWPTSIPLMPATMLILFGAKIDRAAI